MSRVWFPARLALLMMLSACGRADTRRASPFALYARKDMRAGLPFKVLADAAAKESVKQYDCVPLWSKAQRCTIEIQNATLSAVVDSTGRVLRLLAAPDATIRLGVNVHGQLNFRDMVRDLHSAWDSVGTMQFVDDDPLAPQLVWSDRTHRWGAAFWYSRVRRASGMVATSATARATELSMSVPESIAVTDLPAYALFAQSHPPAVVAVAEVAIPSVVQTAPTPSNDDILTMMRSDLRAVTIAEESALHQNGVYETRLERLQLTWSPGVHVELAHPTEAGWAAIATHADLPEVSCVVYAGDVSGIPITRKQARHGGVGEVVCDQP